VIAGCLFWFFVLIIIYTYLGFPALLAFFARIFPRPLHLDECTPQVTLLIAAYNEEALIAGKLENALALNYPQEKLQILVAADGSDDATVEIVKRFADRGVELSYDAVRSGKMAAIHRAMSRARGEIIVFSDANNMYQPDTMRHLLSPFADPEVGAVSGAKRIVRGGGALGESEGLYWKYESFIKEQETRLGSTTSAAGEIFAIRKTLYQVPPKRIINDDFFLAMLALRAGYRSVYIPEALSLESVSTSSREEIIRRSRIIAGRYQAIAMAPRLLPWKSPLLVWQIVSHKFLRPLVPFAMIGTLVAGCMAVCFPPPGGTWAWLRLSPPWGTAFLAMQAAFYLLALLGRWFEGRGGKLAKSLYLPAFLVNSNAAAVQGLIHFLSGRQTALWQRAKRRDAPDSSAGPSG
jgi:poly-beta-1,6-N-acetyl-D-glucosamine synthase